MTKHTTEETTKPMTCPHCGSTNVRTNAKDPQTGAKYKNALRVHDTKGNVIKSFYLPDNVQYICDKRRREK